VIARVIVDIKHQSINQMFDYLIHEKDQLNIKKGMRVLVPFTDQNILRLGFVYDIVSTSDLANKYIEEVLDVEPIVSDELFKILDKLTEDPNQLVTEAFQTILPKQLLINYEKIVTVLNEALLPEDLKPFFKHNRWKLRKKDSIYYNRIKTLQQKSIIQIETILKSRDEKRYLTYLRLNQQNFVGTSKQNNVVDLLRATSMILKKELIEQSSRSIVDTLVAKGVIEVIYIVDKLEQQNFNQLTQLPPINSSDVQKIEKIISNKKHQTYVSTYDTRINVFLIHLIHQVIILDKQVLLLVPEQFMIEGILVELSKIFKDEMIVNLNSGQTDKEMLINHAAILDNEAKIVVGARSSVFTQFNRLGLIAVIDSNNPALCAHEGIIYNALEIAKIRAEVHNIPLYLTSSVLSLDSYHKVSIKQYQTIDFEQSFKKHVHLIDMKAELKNGNTKLVSKKLEDAINSALEHNEKVLLVLNQKGYAPFVMCRTCSYVPHDPETLIPLRYDEKQNLLKSNLTKYTENFTKVCPKCGKSTMKSVGSGIDQLINYLHKVYPTKRLLKVDKETITNKTLYQTMDNLNEVDMIVGTQMALKSSLEHKVSLVGVLMIDQWLKLPKFDAFETTYEILSEAKHITSKDLMIQSYDPEHFVLKSMMNSDVYYKEELSRRKLSKLPPYYQVIQLRIEGSSYLKTYQYAQTLKNNLETLNVLVLGPTPSVLLKPNEKYRILLVMKYQGSIELFRHLIKSNSDVNIYMNHTIQWY
jgi:primosomal protein N' (replication factor Y)